MKVVIFIKCAFILSLLGISACSSTGQQQGSQEDSFANEVGDDEDFENEVDLSDENFGEGGSNYGNYSNGGGNTFANEDYDMGTADEAPAGELGDYGVSNGDNLANAEAVAGESNFFEAEGNGGNALFANEAYGNSSGMLDNGATYNYTGNEAGEPVLATNESASETYNAALNPVATENLSAPAFGAVDTSSNLQPALPTASDAAPAATLPVADPVAPLVPTENTELVYKQPDVLPEYSKLRWVGYDFDKDNRLVKVELLTDGQPQYEVLQEKNQATQPELIVRFYETELRYKVRRPIDASEFRSPVAYIRMRENQTEKYVDVIITLRDKVRPKLFAKDGNVQLSFEVPEYYFGKKPEEVAEKIGTAETLSVADILPSFDEGSDQPRTAALVQDPAAKAFDGAPEDGGTPVEPIPVSNVPEGGLPDSFGLPAPESGDTPVGNPIINTPTVPEDEAIDFQGESLDFGAQVEPSEDVLLKQFTIVSRSIGAVAQDNLFEDEGDGLMENGGFNNAAAPSNNFSAGFNNAASNNALEQGVTNNAAGDNGTSNPSLGNGTSVNPAATGNMSAGNANTLGFENNTLINNVPVMNNAAPANLMAPPANAALPLNAAPMNGGMNVPMNGGMNAAAPMNTTPFETPTDFGSDTIGLDAEGGGMPTGQGRPISLEFHKAPLNLVLKTFGEESGNNFIYPADVANTEVTIRLNKVPWDEALKAILETHGLGMVQIGQNVVRIDKLARMNEYLTELNKVREFRERLELTKILVMRLSHGKAKDIAGQVTELLKGEVERDNRIKITADERTNSIVAEGPTSTLGKIKDIVERLDLDTPQVRIASRIVEVAKSASSFLGVVWSNSVNFDPGRGLGFGALPFPNSISSDFTVDPGVSAQAAAGTNVLRFGSLNNFLDLDLILKMEERKGTTNILQNNSVLVLDRNAATISAGSSQFFRPAPGGNIINQGPAPAGGGGGGNNSGLAEVQFNLELNVTPEVTATGTINMTLDIKSDTPSPTSGDALASKQTRQLTTKMTKRSGETAVIGGIYDNKRTKIVVGVPLLSDIPILGALFRSTQVSDTQSELLVMVTPTLVSNSDGADTAYQDGFGGGSVVPAPAVPPAGNPFAPNAQNFNNGGNLNSGNNMYEEGNSAGNGAYQANYSNDTASGNYGGNMQGNYFNNAEGNYNYSNNAGGQGNQGVMNNAQWVDDATEEANF